MLILTSGFCSLGSVKPLSVIQRIVSVLFLLVHFLTLVFFHNLKPAASFCVLVYCPAWFHPRTVPLLAHVLAHGLMAISVLGTLPETLEGVWLPLLHSGPNADPVSGDKASPGYGARSLTVGTRF